MSRNDKAHPEEIQSQREFVVGEMIPRSVHHLPSFRMEHYIPLRKPQLIRLLKEQVPRDRHRQLDSFCAIVEATLHHQYHERLETLKDHYAPFDPDCATISDDALKGGCNLPKNFEAAKSQEYRANPGPDTSQTAFPGDDSIPSNAVHTSNASRVNDGMPQSVDQRATNSNPPLAPEAFFPKFSELLLRANYYQLSREEIEQALDTTSEWGLHLSVDLDVFEHLEVWARGQELDHRVRRRWRNLYRPKTVEVFLLQRLVLVFRLKRSTGLARPFNEEQVYIKMFKNMPQPDINMLLPATQFKMTLFDRGKIILPTLSGIIMSVVKIVQGGLMLAFAGIYGILALLGLIGGTIGYGVKSFLNYLRTKDKYQLSLTRSLYYQNLDNNAGVLFRLLDEAEAQEFREAVIGYVLLWIEGAGTSWTQEQLDRRAEAWLATIVDYPIDFEVHDAIEKLVRWGCVKKTETGWCAVPIEQALACMDRAWNAIFNHH